MMRFLSRRKERALQLFLGVTLAMAVAPATAQFRRPEKPLVATTLAQTGADFLVLGQQNPRGLDYREVVVAAPDFVGRFRTLRPVALTHGWVFSPRDGAGTLQVLTWNGWSYPVLFLGARKDVRADIEAVLQHEARATSKDTRRFDAGWGSRADNVSFETLSPFKAVLLQQLGETDLAHRVLLAWNKGKDTSLQDAPIVRGQFLQEWMSPGVNRAVRAFRQGDDASALKDLRRLINAPASLGLPPDFRKDGDLLSQLLVDSERRVESKTPAPSPGTLDFLIWDLQNMRGAESIGGSNFVLLEDARVQAIVARGDEAVEPLIVAFESDKRLTRQILDDNSHGPLIRGVTSVSRAALLALESLLDAKYEDDLWLLYQQQPFVRGKVSLPPESLLARQIRADWAKVRGVPRLERYFLFLQDDAAGEKKWLEAADFLVRPLDWDDQAAGEPLRVKRNPSLSEILARRSNQLAQAKPEFAAQFALLLYRWDKAASGALILARMRELSALKIAPNDDYFGAARYLPELLRAAPAGEGRQIYADWLRNLPRTEYTLNYLQPLWAHLEDPFWREVATALFQTGSPWNRVLVPGPKMFWDLRGVASAPLFIVPEWNAIVRRDLADESPLGSVKWGLMGGDSVQLHFDIAGTAGWGSGFDPQDAGVAPSGETDLRVCDLIARELSAHWRRVGAPAFEAYWPRARRDAALKLLVIWVAARNNDAAFPKRSSIGYSR